MYVRQSPPGLATEATQVSAIGVFDYVAPAGTKINLNSVYVDALTATDGVVGWYVPV